MPARSRGHRPGTGSGHHRRRPRRDFSGARTRHSPLMVMLESGGMNFDAKTQALYAGHPDRRPLSDARRLAAALSGRQHQSLGRLVPAARPNRFRGTQLAALFGLAVQAQGNRALFSSAHKRCAKRDPASTTKPIMQRRQWGRYCSLGRAASTHAGSSSAKCAAASCPPISATAMPTISSEYRSLSVYLHANVTRLGLNCEWRQGRTASTSQRSRGANSR